MISREQCFCEVRKTNVIAYVEESARNRGRKQPSSRNPVACAESSTCPRTAFCRFVNPLTTRNPLTPADASASPEMPAEAQDGVTAAPSGVSGSRIPVRKRT